MVDMSELNEMEFRGGQKSVFVVTIDFDKH